MIYYLLVILRVPCGKGSPANPNFHFFIYGKNDSHSNETEVACRHFSSEKIKGLKCFGNSESEISIKLLNFLTAYGLCLVSSETIPKGENTEFKYFLKATPKYPILLEQIVE